VFGLSGVAFAALGCLAAFGPLFWRYREASSTGSSDEESLKLYLPEDAVAREVENFINSHPLVAELRRNADFTESRPHLKIPEFWKKHNLTGSTLLGPGKIVVPPFAWNEKGGKSMVSIAYLGSDLCGHPGMVHGGLLATMLDEGFARCCFAVLPDQVGVTAKLDINYRKPTKADSYVVLRAKTTKVEGRKAWVEGRIETLAAPGETPTVLVEASALFISPKFAKVSELPMARSRLHADKVRQVATQVSRLIVDRRREAQGS
jgi:3'-phosphoadenosine 5'-phosphosulfate synthase